MPQFPITGIASVEFVVPDVARAHAFYTETWGLFDADVRNGAVWLRGTGDEPYLLSLREGTTTGITAMNFRVADGVDLRALGEAVTAAGGRVDDERDHDALGGGRALTVRDAAGRTIRLVQGAGRVAPLAPDPDRPERLAHVNFNSDDVDRDRAFFTDALCFTLTDRSKMMAFVRTNDDHHSVVIADAPFNTLNHVAFQIPAWEGVMRASGRMVDAGFPIGWGPGRHGPGNNVFAYFVDPFGFVIEYTADVLQVDDGYSVGQPKDWIWPEGRTDQWGIAPPKTAACKAAQLAIPFL